jgi:hypothetical protein
MERGWYIEDIRHKTEVDMGKHHVRTDDTRGVGRYHETTNYPD